MRDLANNNVLQKRLFFPKALGFIALFLFFGFGALSNSLAGVAPILGTWQTQSQSQITIEPCEMGYCGFITKIVIPEHIRVKYGEDLASIQGEMLDYLNKDATLRGRPIQGLKILTIVSQSAPNRLEGIIYNPEDGETYEGYLEIKDNNNIRLSGCVLFNLICLGEDWVRVPALQAEN